MKKVVSLEEAGKLIKNEMTVMIGGFLKTGGPQLIIDEMIKNDVKDLT